MKTTLLKHSILSAVLMACIASANAQTCTKITRSAKEYINIDEDSSVTPARSIITYRDGLKQYDITMEMDKVVELYVDHKKISPDSFYLYNKVINKIKGQIEKDQRQAEEDQKQAELDMVQAKRDQEQAAEDMKQAELDKMEAQKDMEQAEIDRKQSLEDSRQADKDEQQAVMDKKQAMKDMEQAKKDEQQARLDQKHAEEDRALIKSLVDDLIKEKIIPDEKSLSNLTLNDDEFTVNGTRQSEYLHNKYKAKFLKKPGYSVSYGGYSSGFGIYLKDYKQKSKE